MEFWSDINYKQIHPHEVWNVCFVGLAILGSQNFSRQIRAYTPLSPRRTCQNRQESKNTKNIAGIENMINTRDVENIKNPGSIEFPMWSSRRRAERSLSFMTPRHFNYLRRFSPPERRASTKRRWFSRRVFGELRLIKHRSWKSRDRAFTVKSSRDFPGSV